MDLKKRNESICKGLVSFIIFSIYLTEYLVNISSRDIASVFKIQTNNVGIYLTKLYSFSMLLKTIGSSLEYIILAYLKKDISPLTVLVVFLTLSLSRYTILCLIRFPSSLYLYILLNIEAFFCGHLQALFLYLAPNYTQIIRLTKEVSGGFVSCLQTLLDLCLYNNPELALKIHTLICLSTSLLSFGLCVVLFNIMGFQKNYQDNLSDIILKIGSISPLLNPLEQYFKQPENNYRQIQELRNIDIIIKELEDLGELLKNIKPIDNIGDLSELKESLEELKETEKNTNSGKIDSNQDKIKSLIDKTKPIENLSEEKTKPLDRNKILRLESKLYYPSITIRSIKRKINYIKEKVASTVEIRNELNIIELEHKVEKLDKNIKSIKEKINLEKIYLICSEITNILNKEPGRKTEAKEKINNLIKRLEAIIEIKKDISYLNAIIIEINTCAKNLIEPQISLIQGTKNKISNSMKQINQQGGNVKNLRTIQSDSLLQVSDKVNELIYKDKLYTIDNSKELLEQQLRKIKDIYTNINSLTELHYLPDSISDIILIKTKELSIIKQKLEIIEELGGLGLMKSTKVPKIIKNNGILEELERLQYSVNNSNESQQDEELSGIYGSGMDGSGIYGSGIYGSGMDGSGIYGSGMELTTEPNTTLDSKLNRLKSIKTQDTIRKLYDLELFLKKINNKDDTIELAQIIDESDLSEKDLNNIINSIKDLKESKEFITKMNKLNETLSMIKFIEKNPRHETFIGEIGFIIKDINDQEISKILNIPENPENKNTEKYQDSDITEQIENRIISELRELDIIGSSDKETKIQKTNKGIKDMLEEAKKQIKNQSETNSSQINNINENLKQLSTDLAEILYNIDKGLLLEENTTVKNLKNILAKLTNAERDLRSINTLYVGPQSDKITGQIKQLGLLIEHIELYQKTKEERYLRWINDIKKTLKPAEINEIRYIFETLKDNKTIEKIEKIEKFIQKFNGKNDIKGILPLKNTFDPCQFDLNILKLIKKSDQIEELIKKLEKMGRAISDLNSLYEKRVNIGINDETETYEGLKLEERKIENRIEELGRQKQLKEITKEECKRRLTIDIQEIKFKIRELQSNMKNIDFYYHLKNVFSPFAVIFVASFIKDILYPAIIPYGILEFKKCDRIVKMIPIGSLIGSEIVYYIDFYVYAFKFWKPYFNSVWAHIVPQTLIFILAILTINSKLDSHRYIRNSQNVIMVMSVVLMFSYGITESFSYISVTNYVCYKSRYLGESINLLIYHDILTLFFHYIFSKLSIGYTDTIFRFKYNTTSHYMKHKEKGKDVSYSWFFKTIMGALTDVFLDFKLNIKDYI